MEDLITQAEAADIRGVSLRAINNLVRRGRLRSTERFGKTLVYRSDVLAYKPSPGGRPPQSASADKRATGRKQATEGISTGKKRGKK